MCAQAIDSGSGGPVSEVQKAVLALEGLAAPEAASGSGRRGADQAVGAVGAVGADKAEPPLRDPVATAISLLAAKGTSAADQEALLAALTPKIAPTEISTVFERVLKALRVGKVKSVAAAQELISRCLECTGDYPRCAALYDVLLAWCDAQSMDFLSTRVRLDMMDLQLRSRDPELTARAADEAERLVSGMKDKDASAQLAKAQIAAIEALHRIGHTKAAKGHMMTARAVNIRLTASVQARLDCASGAVCMDSGEFSGAMGYFQEACNAGYPCFSQLVLTKLASGRYSEVDQTLSKRAQLQTPEAMAKLEKGGLGSHHSLGELQTVDTAILVPLRELAGVLQDMTSRTFLRDLDEKVERILGSGSVGDGRDLLPAEIRRYLSLLVKMRTTAYLRRTLRPYSRVELARVAEISGVPLDRLQPLLMQMIVDGRLDFVIDESDGCLEARSARVSDAWVRLEEGKEVLSDLFSLASQVLS